MLVSGSWDNSVKLWALPSGTLLRTLEGHENWVNCVCFSPDGQIIASASNDSTVKLWRVSDGELLRTLVGHGGHTVGKISFSPDGKLVASIGSAPDFTVKLWNVVDGSLVLHITEHAYVISAAFSPLGDVIGTGSNDGSVKLWKVPEGRLLGSPRGALSDARYRAWNLSFSPDGQLLAARMGEDNDIILISVSDGATIRTLKCESSLTWLKFTLDGSSMLLPGYYSINQCTVPEGRVSTLLKESDQIQSSAISPSGKVAAVTKFLSQEVIEIKALPGGKLIATLNGHTKRVDSVAFSPSTIV